MTMPQTSATTGDSQTNEPVTAQNWPLHTVDRLEKIGRALEAQNSTGTTVKNALIMTGAVMAGSLAATGILKLGSWIFSPSPAKVQ